MKLSYRSFAAGEVSKRLGARVDQVKYQTGAHTMRNFVSTLEGAAMNRSGFGYIRPCHSFTADNAPRLLPFVFSDDQSYVIVLEHERLSIISLAEPQFETFSPIGGVTQANPAVVSTGGPAHGLSTDSLVWITGCTGMTQLNNRFFRVVVLSPSTYSLQEESGANVDATGYGAYAASGIAREVYSITTPWDGADLRQIRFAQSADVMFFAHPDYPVQKLTRTAGPLWTLEPVVFEPGIDGPTGASGSGNAAGSEDLRYQITAVSDANLEESFPQVDDPVAITSITETALGVAKVITNITAANPPVVTSAAHGFTNGQTVWIDAVTGMTEVNGEFYQVAAVAPNTFALQQNGANVDGSGWTPYAAGGTAQLALPLAVVTATPHGMSADDEIAFSGVEAPFTALNSGYYTVTVTGPSAFTINDNYGATTQSDNPAAAEAVRTSIYLPSITFPSSVAPVTLQWDVVIGALEYNVYRSINGVYAYVGTSGTEAFEDLGYDSDPFDTPPIDRDVFAEPGKYPAAVGLFQQRLLLGGSTDDSERIDAGRTGLFFNFTKSNPVQADDSFSWVMRSNQVQGIRHILEMSRCLIFTQSSIFTLEGNEAGALVPTAINPRKRAEHGVGDVAPIPVGNAVIYVQAFGKIVREILPGSGDDFNSKDLTVYSRHLFDRNSVVAWSYAEEPSSMVWAVRDDGTLLGFTYLREHEVAGWHRHDTGQGDKFIDVCSVPEGEESATYAVVRRFGVGEGDRYYIERLGSRQVVHQADGRFLDSYRYHEDENEDAGDTYTLDHSEGDGWTLEATGTTAAWTVGDESPDINRVILLYGSDGQRYWCTVLSVTSTDVAVVSVRTDVPGEYNEDSGAFYPAIDSDGAPTDVFPETLPFVTAEWSQSVAELTDLWHLEGRGVRVVGDGYPQGPFIVTDGTITLASPAVQVVTGVQIIADLVTLEPDNPNGETWTGLTKTVSEIDVRVEETDGVRIGTSWSTLSNWDATKRLDRPLPAELQPYTGTYRANCGGLRSLTGRVHIRQTLGLPTTILGIYPKMELAR